MDELLVPILVNTAGLTAALAILLAVVKLIHRAVQQWRGVRTAHYVSALGEMLSRRILPSQPPEGWTRDTLFHEAIAEYRLLVTGEDRAFIDGLVEQLGIGDLLVERTKRKFPRSARLGALSSLVKLATPRHRDSLLRMIDDSDPNVRINAVRALAELGDTGAVSHILDIATRVTPWEAARTADALIEMGPAAVDSIVHWIEHELKRREPSIEVVALAGRLLGLIGEPAAEPVLLRLLGSAEPDWRVAAASALEHVGSDAAVQPLRLALHDETAMVRARAVVALGAMAEPAVIEEIAQLLTDDAWWVRQNAAGALARLPGGKERLFAALDNADHFAADAALSQLTSSGALAARDAAAAGS
jgi:HEAT repeat protein